MKKLIIIFLTLTTLHNSMVAQSKSNAGVAAAAATAVVGLVALGVTMDNINEMLELQATQHILENQTTDSHFSCKLISTDASKLSDMSNVSIVPFLVERPSGKSVLIMFVSKGWLTDYGIDLALVQFQEYSPKIGINLYFITSKRVQLCLLMIFQQFHVLYHAVRASLTLTTQIMSRMPKGVCLRLLEDWISQNSHSRIPKMTKQMRITNFQ